MCSEVHIVVVEVVCIARYFTCHIGGLFYPHAWISGREFIIELAKVEVARLTCGRIWTIISLREETFLLPLLKGCIRIVLFFVLRGTLVSILTRVLLLLAIRLIGVHILEIMLLILLLDSIRLLCLHSAPFDAESHSSLPSASLVNLFGRIITVSILDSFDGRSMGEGHIIEGSSFVSNQLLVEHPLSI